MGAVAALLDNRAALQALRRSVARGSRVVSCRSQSALHRALESRLIDAVVVAPSAAMLPNLQELRARLPGIPVIAFAPFRPDDGELLLACSRCHVAAVVVEGVDDAVVGELVARHSATAARRRALADAPRVLRLTEPLQQQAWDLLLGEVEHPIRTGTLAQRLKVSREHLSRQFGAGGAPNLKRVIDLTRIACAAQLLENPGYDVSGVVRLLHFASVGHLNMTARRIANVPTRQLWQLGPRGVLAAFVRGNTRSRT